MSRIGTFLMGAMVGAALIFGAQRYHLMRTKEGFYWIPKVTASFSESYVDVRNYSVTDWSEHRSLAAAVVQAKKEHLLGDAVADGLRNGLRNAVESLSGGSS